MAFLVGWLVGLFDSLLLQYQCVCFTKSVGGWFSVDGCSSSNRDGTIRSRCFAFVLVLDFQGVVFFFRTTNDK